MQALVAAWRTAVENEDLFAVRHSDGCYSARFIRRGAEIAAEVFGEDVALNAPVGTIRIKGMAASTGKFACFKSYAEALKSHKRGSENVVAVQATFSSVRTDTGLRLAGVKSDPEWFGRMIMSNVTENLASWSAVGAQKFRSPNR
jgi:hypothetical protein